MIPLQQTTQLVSLVGATFSATALLSECSKIKLSPDLPYEPKITEGLTILPDQTSITLDGLPSRFSSEVEDGGEFIRLNIFDYRFCSSNDGTKYVMQCRSVAHQPYLNISYVASPNTAPNGAANLEQCISEDAELIPFLYQYCFDLIYCMLRNSALAAFFDGWGGGCKLVFSGSKHRLGCRKKPLEASYKTSNTSSWQTKQLQHG